MLKHYPFRREQETRTIQNVSAATRNAKVLQLSFENLALDNTKLDLYNATLYNPTRKQAPGQPKGPREPRRPQKETRRPRGQREREAKGAKETTLTSKLILES